MWALAYILHWITGKPRYFPDFKWSDTSWTYNIFRAFGMIFGERYGIRHEASFDVQNRILYCYSWESFFASIEEHIKRFSFPLKIWVPVLKTPTGLPVFASPYLFAIAIDNQAVPNSNSSTYTVTGANPFLVEGLLDNLGADPNPTSTYNTVSMTLIDRVQYPSDRWTHMFILQAPSTGANTLAVSGTNFTGNIVASYSGCAQTGQPDSHSNTTTSGNPWVQSTTVVASNCWIVGFEYGISPNATAVSPGVIRQDNQNVNGDALADSNGTVGTGSQSLSWSPNGAARTAVGTMISIAPVAATTTVHFLTLLGVGK